MLVIEDEGMFHKPSLAVGMELDSINIITMNMFPHPALWYGISSKPQKSHLKDVMFAFMQPTVLYIILFSAWRYRKAIAIVIMVFEDILMMQQYHRAHLSDR